MGVCVCVFVLLNGGWVNGWLFVFTLGEEYAGCLCLLHLSVPIWGNENLCTCAGWVVRCGSAVCVRTVLCIREFYSEAKHNRIGQNVETENTSASQTARDFRKQRISGNATRFSQNGNGAKAQDLRKHKTEKLNRNPEYNISERRLSVRQHSEISESRT